MTKLSHSRSSAGLCPVTKDDPTPCTPGQVTWVKTTSSAELKAFPADLAVEYNVHVRVHSGDRDFVPKGGAKHSAHLEKKAIDLHLYEGDGSQISDEAAAVMVMSSQALEDHKARVIWHDKGTQTEAPHIHVDLRRDAGDRHEMGGQYGQLVEYLMNRYFSP